MILALALACSTPPAQPLHPEPTQAARTDAAQLARDLAFVARPRPPGTDAWQEVQDACAARLEAAGLEVTRQAYGTGVNVVGLLPGRLDERVVVVAHYDHIPDCPGADDNASGVSGLWALADAVRPGDRTLVLACVDEEERGLIGAQALARSLQAPVHAMLSVEMIGYSDPTPGSQSVPAGFDWAFRGAWRELEAREHRGDFLFFVGDPSSRHAARALRAGGEVAGLPVIGFTSPLVHWVPDLGRSDHAVFWDLGLPGMMVTDTANFRYPGYHCRGGPDTVDRLDPQFHHRSVEAILHATEALLRE